MSKRADSVAQALVLLFTIIGPPLILQTDNGGGGFAGVAYTHNEIICMELNHEVRLPYFLLFKYCGIINNLMLHFFYSFFHFSMDMSSGKWNNYGQMLNLYMDLLAIIHNQMEVC